MSVIYRMSPTNLDRWYTLGCPAAWNYAREYTPLTKNPYAELGTLVHALLEGKIAAKDCDNTQALGLYKKIHEMKSLLGFTAMLDKQGRPMAELKQEWKLEPVREGKGFVFVRKIDLLATDGEGVPCIVDWKTHAGYGWKSLLGANEEIIYPQTKGTQTCGYFLDPPKKMLTDLGLRNWPTRMYYVVGPARGSVQVFREDRNPDADQNFQTLLSAAITTIRALPVFPKVAGKHCFDCEFQALCYEAPGFNDYYETYHSS